MEADPRKRDAVLFDIDGTLLDTMEWVRRAYAHVLEANKLPELTSERIEELMAIPLIECYTQLANGTCLNSKGLCTLHRAHQLDHLHLVQAYPGVREMLRELRDRKIAIGAVTDRTRETSIPTLKAADLMEFMDVVVSLEDVEPGRHKPHPDLILKALATLEVRPERAIMVGDMDKDICAGDAAGVRTVGVRYGFGKGMFLHSNPGIIISSINQLIPMVCA